MSSSSALPSVQSVAEIQYEVKQLFLQYPVKEIGAQLSRLEADLNEMDRKTITSPSPDPKNVETESKKKEQRAKMIRLCDEIVSLSAVCDRLSQYEGTTPKTSSTKSDTPSPLHQSQLQMCDQWIGWSRSTRSAFFQIENLLFEIRNLEKNKRKEESGVSLSSPPNPALLTLQPLRQVSVLLQNIQRNAIENVEVLSSNPSPPSHSTQQLPRESSEVEVARSRAVRNRNEELKVFQSLCFQYKKQVLGHLRKILKSVAHQQTQFFLEHSQRNDPENKESSVSPPEMNFSSTVNALLEIISILFHAFSTSQNRKEALSILFQAEEKNKYNFESDAERMLFSDPNNGRDTKGAKEAATTEKDSSGFSRHPMTEYGALLSEVERCTSNGGNAVYPAVMLLMLVEQIIEEKKTLYETYLHHTEGNGGVSKENNKVVKEARHFTLVQLFDQESGVSERGTKFFASLSSHPDPSYLAMYVSLFSFLLHHATVVAVLEGSPLVGGVWEGDTSSAPAGAHRMNPLSNATAQRVKQLLLWSENSKSYSTRNSNSNNTTGKTENGSNYSDSNDYYQALLSLCASPYNNDPLAAAASSSLRMPSNTSNSVNTNQDSSSRSREKDSLRALTEVLRGGRLVPFITTLITEYTYNPFHILLFYQMSTRQSIKDSTASTSPSHSLDQVLVSLSLSSVEKVLLTLWNTFQLLLSQHLTEWSDHSNPTAKSNGNPNSNQNNNNNNNNSNSNSGYFLDILNGAFNSSNENSNSNNKHSNSSSSASVSTTELFCYLLDVITKWETKQKGDTNSHQSGNYSGSINELYEEIISVLRETQKYEKEIQRVFSWHKTLSFVQESALDVNVGKQQASTTVENRNTAVLNETALFSGRLLQELTNGPSASTTPPSSSVAVRADHYTTLVSIVAVLMRVLLDSLSLLHKEEDHFGSTGSNSGASSSPNSRDNIILNLLQKVSKWFSEAILLANSKVDRNVKYLQEIPSTSATASSGVVVGYCLSVCKARQTLFPLLNGIAEMEVYFSNDNPSSRGGAGSNTHMRDSFVKSLEQLKKNAVFVLEKCETAVQEKILVTPFVSRFQRIHEVERFQTYRDRIFKLLSFSSTPSSPAAHPLRPLVVGHYYTLLFTACYPSSVNTSDSTVSSFTAASAVPQVLSTEMYTTLQSLGLAIDALQENENYYYQLYATVRRHHDSDSPVPSSLKWFANITRLSKGSFFRSLLQHLTQYLEKQFIPSLQKEMSANPLPSKGNLEYPTALKNGVLFLLMELYFELYLLQLIILDNPALADPTSQGALLPMFQYLLETVLARLIQSLLTHYNSQQANTPLDWTSLKALLLQRVEAFYQSCSFIFSKNKSRTPSSHPNDPSHANREDPQSEKSHFSIQFPPHAVERFSLLPVAQPTWSDPAFSSGAPTTAGPYPRASLSWTAGVGGIDGRGGAASLATHSSPMSHLDPSNAVVFATDGVNNQSANTNTNNNNSTTTVNSKNSNSTGITLQNSLWNSLWKR